MSTPRRHATRPAKLTGGGGFTFEDEVGAFLVCALAAGYPLLGTELGPIERIRWQVPASDMPLDDVVIEVADGRRCAASIRSFNMLTGGRVEEEFVRRAWASLLNGALDPGRDEVGIFMADRPQGAWQDLQALITQARAGAPQDLANRIVSGSESSARAGLYESLACPPDLRESLPIPPEASAAWLLARLIPLSFDFEAHPSDSRSQREELARAALIDEQSGRADDLAVAALRLVVSRRSRGGGLDWSVLQRELGRFFAFAVRPDAQSDVRLMQAQGLRAMDAVTSTLGTSLVLRERSAMEDLLQATDSSQLVALVGPSGCGKTVLAKQWLRFQADGLWFRASDLDRGLNGFRNDLQLMRRPDEVLRLMPYGTCVVIDGLDRTYDESVVSAARELLAAVSERPDLRLVLTAQDEDWPRVRRQLTEATDVGPFTVVSIPDFDDADLAAVYTDFPQLTSFVTRNEIAGLLRRPKILDLLVRRLPAEQGEGSLATDLDEAQFADWFWERFVEEGPEPIARSAAMLRLGERQAQDLRSATPEIDIEPAELPAVQSLVEDRMLHREGSTIRFGHDLYGDWARYRALALHEEDLASRFSGDDDLLLWHRALRLRALALLRHDPSGTRWDRERRALEAAGLRGIRDRYLEAPLFASRPAFSLTALWPLLVADNGAVLRQLLDVFRFVATFPDPRVLSAVEELGEEVVDHITANYRLPRFPLWFGVVTLLRAHVDEVIEFATWQVAKICTTWLNGTPLDWRLREEVADVAVALGRHTLQQMSNGATYADDLDVACWKAVLAAGHERPEEVADVLMAALADKAPPAVPEPPSTDDEAALMRHRMVHGPFRDQPEGVLGHYEDALRTAVLEDSSLSSLIRARPDLARDVLVTMALKRKGETEDWHDLDGRGGVYAPMGQFSGWPGQGPFPQFFKLAPEQALSALLAIIKRAANEDADDSDEWLTLRSSLGPTPRQWHGTAEQLGWHRGLGREAPTLVSALMAAEQWLYELVDADDASLNHFIDRMLDEDESLVSVGLLASVARKQPALLGGPLKSLAMNGDLLLRESLIEPLAGVPSVLRAGTDLAAARRLAEWDALPHRRVSLLDAVRRLALFHDEMAADLQDLLADLRVRIEGGEEELSDLAYALDRTNYETAPDGQGALILRGREERVREIEAQQSELADQSWWMLFPSVCRRAIDQGARPTLPELDAFWDDALRRLKQVPQGHALTSAQEAFQHCACGLAAVMVLCGEALPPGDNRQQRSRDLLLAPLEAWEDQARIEPETGMIDWQWPGFCADALVPLWATTPDDAALRRAIAALACDSDIGVVTRVYTRAAEHRERLRANGAQLRAFSIHRASALDQAAEHRHRSQEWSFDVHEYVPRDAGPPPALIAESLNDFVAGITSAELPANWGDEVLEESRGQRLYRGKARIDMDYLHAAWSWLPDLSAAGNEGERQEWLAFWFELSKLCRSRMLADPKGHHDLPLEAEAWALRRLGGVLAELGESPEGDALSRALLETGTGAEKWVDDVMQGFFATGLSEALPPRGFARRWQSILTYVENAVEWRKPRSLRFTLALLGMDDLTRGLWRAEHEPVWAAVQEAWSQTVQDQIADPWFAERLAYFLEHATSPSWLTDRALCWFATAAEAGRYKGRRSSEVHDDLASWLSALHRRNPHCLLGSAPSARCGRRLVGYLADEGVALARQLQSQLGTGDTNW